MATPVLQTGDTARFFTDTGGGLFIYSDAAEALGVSVDSSGFALLPSFRPLEGIPPPLGSPEGKLFVLGADGRPADGNAMLDQDGMLGQAWFADRVWMFDYPGRRLLLLDSAATRAAVDPVHEADLYFKEDSTGTRILHFPRIRVEIAGDSLDLLFDTGAQVQLTPEALAVLDDDGPAQRATSFVTTSLVDQWTTRHPDWLVIDGADQAMDGMRMLRVPEMLVAGHRVGPVWFTERPDVNFHEYMANFMDRSVDGALGGSGLHFFRVTVDYPRAMAVFERGDVPDVPPVMKE